tara:strand:+ start:2936 stop:3187 length:252 start_codon:yes stop_codon:yes gene_type:complete
MSKISFIFLLLIFSISSYAQDNGSSMKPILHDEALALRYGKDSDSIFCFQPAIKMTPVFLRKERAQKNHPKVVSISLVKAFKA